ncbi:Transcriptional regulator OS=Streptomyces fumanus OX=67302 GN=GCM10018772_17960 PE=4 SV=1 [Streptomyces fumanus]
MARDAGAITEVAFRPALSAPIGMDVVDFAELRARGRRRGIDLSSPQRPAFHHLIHVHPGSPPLDHTVDFTRHVVPPGAGCGCARGRSTSSRRDPRGPGRWRTGSS